MIISPRIKKHGGCTHMTFVFKCPTDPLDMEKFNKAIDVLRPFQTGKSLSDEMTILDEIENHPEFPSHIAAQVRAKHEQLRKYR